LQRQFKDTSPDSNYTQRQTNAAETSATAGEASAVFGGVSAASGILFGILGAVYAAEAAHAGRRQADAAEDPPVGQPIEGGAKSNNPVDVPEVKAPDKESTETETVTVTNTTAEALKAGKIAKGDTQTVKTTKKPDGQTIVETTTKHKGGDTETEKTLVKPPGSTDATEKTVPVDLLKIQEGDRNMASYRLNLIVNNSDIKGGNTEDGDIVGYTGGSAASNVNVNFKAKAASPVSPGGDKAPPIAAVLIQFGGYNTPPRMELRQASDDKPVKTANNPQRFSGTLKFDATGKLAANPVTSVNPKGTGSAPAGYGTGKEGDPVVFIALNTSGGDPGKKKEEKKP
jgi:hypothetical protein